MTVHRITLTDEEGRMVKRYVDDYLSLERIQGYMSHVWRVNTYDRRLNPNLIGLLGEAGVAKYVGVGVEIYLAERPRFTADRGWDIIIADQHMDVKTKSKGYAPDTSKKSEYMVSKRIADGKSPDGYVFAVSPLAAPSLVYIVGCITKPDFMAKKTMHLEGEEQREMRHRPYMTDTYEVTYSALSDMDLLHRPRLARAMASSSG